MQNLTNQPVVGQPGRSRSDLNRGMAFDRANEDRFQEMKKELHQRLIRALDMAAVAQMDHEHLRSQIRHTIEEYCRTTSELLNAVERERLVNEILDETFGFGPLEGLLADPTISDILINGPKQIYVERQGKLESSPVVFHDEDHLLQIVQRICAKVNRRVDESSPMVDARLPDGSRVNAIIPPISMTGTLVSIRKFSKQPLMAADLIKHKSVTPEIISFLEACVFSRMNMVVSGGTGSGKTTLLNMLSGYIPENERVCTIEDTAELRLQQEHVVTLETRAPNAEGNGEINTRDLVKNALRMRPDRIVIGECRGGEALDMLQAMNTGHEGSLTTIHANDTREALSRLEMMTAMGSGDLPIWILRRQIASAVDIIVQTARLRGGKRKITKVSEIVGMESDTISMQDLFVFQQTGIDSQGVAEGYFECTGIRPKCFEKLISMGNQLSADLFTRKQLTPMAN